MIHHFNPRIKGVQNKLLNVDDSIYIPITKAEFAVLVSSLNVSLQFKAQYQIAFFFGYKWKGAKMKFLYFEEKTNLENI